MRLKTSFTLFFVLSMFFLGTFGFSNQVAAQEEDDSICSAEVARILTEVGNNCANMSRNTACFGHPRIDYTRFTQPYPAEYFTQPGDRADLTTTETIQTGPYNFLTEEWGVSVMSVQANLPNALLGNGVVYIHTGGVEVENDIEPEEAVILPASGINVMSIASVDMMTDPPSRLPVEFVLVVPSGVNLSADALDETGDYVRVIYQNRPGWVARAALDPSVDLSSLPSINVESFTPMQSFYFRVGIGGIACEEAPSLLFVQGPANTPVDIRVHLHDIRIESSVVLRTLPPGDQLGDFFEVITLFGLARIYPGTPNEIVVPPGYYARIPFCDVWASLGIEGDADEKAGCGGWSTPAPLTAEQLAALGIISNLPPNIINYPVDPPVIISASPQSLVLPQLIFTNANALTLAQTACQEGELSDDVCEYLGL